MKRLQLDSLDLDVWERDVGPQASQSPAFRGHRVLHVYAQTWWLRVDVWPYDRDVVTYLKVAKIGIQTKTHESVRAAREWVAKALATAGLAYPYPEPVRIYRATSEEYARLVEGGEVEAFVAAGLEVGDHVLFETAEGEEVRSVVFGCSVDSPAGLAWFRGVLP